MDQLIIKRDMPVQENFLGVNAIYHGFAGMPMTLVLLSRNKKGESDIYENL